MLGLIIFFVLYVLGGVFTFIICTDAVCNGREYITIGETLSLLFLSLFSFIPGVCSWLIEHSDDPLIKRKK